MAKKTSKKKPAPEEEEIEIEDEEDMEEDDNECEESPEDRAALEELAKELIAELRSFAISPTELAKIIQTTPVVIVDFWSEDCGPCLQMAQLMKGILAPYLKFHPNVRYTTIEVEKYEKYCSDQGIEGVPSFIGYVQGKKVMFREDEEEKEILVGSTPFHFGEFLRIIEEFEHGAKSDLPAGEKKKSGKTK